MSSERLMGIKRYYLRVRVWGVWNGSMILRRRRNIIPMDRVVLIHAYMKMHGGRGRIIVLNVFMGAVQSFYSKCHTYSTWEMTFFATIWMNTNFYNAELKMWGGTLVFQNYLKGVCEPKNVKNSDIDSHVRWKAILKSWLILTWANTWPWQESGRCTFAQSSHCLSLAVCKYFEYAPLSILDGMSCDLPYTHLWSLAVPDSGFLKVVLFLQPFLFLH